MKFLPKGRLDAFADGVFAIVITLLVLDLVVPEGSVNIISALLQEWPVFLAYLISFAFIGSAWISHSSVTSLMKQETPHSYRLTLLMLFFVALLPFTTKLMATYLGHPPAFPGNGLRIRPAVSVSDGECDYENSHQHSGHDLRTGPAGRDAVIDRDHEISNKHPGNPC